MKNGAVRPVFRKSSYSGAVNSNCVELAATPGRVLVRDSKRPDAGVLRLSKAESRMLLERLRGR